MPAIEVDLESEIVEARITLTTSRLHDVLRILVGQSNVHDGDIEVLKEQLSKVTSKCDRLEFELSQLRPDGDRITNIESDVKALKNKAGSLQEDVEMKFESLTRSSKARNDDIDGQIQVINDRHLKESMIAKESLKGVHALANENKARLDALVIPDISPLKTGIESLNSWRATASGHLEDCCNFITLFNPDFERLRRLQVSRIDGYNRMDEKVEYALSLPPMEALQKLIQAQAAGVKSWAESRFGDVALRLTEKIDKTEITSFVNEMRDQQRDLRQALEFTERRLKEAEALGSRLRTVEDRCRGLQTCKAEADALDLKADASALREAQLLLSETRDDVATLFEKAGKDALLGRSASGLGGAGTGLGKSIDRRLSMAGGAGAGGASALSTDDRRRLLELEAAVTVLDRKKADRQELMRLHDFIEALENLLRHSGLPTTELGPSAFTGLPSGLAALTAYPASTAASNASGGGGSTTGGGQQQQQQGRIPMSPVAPTSRPPTGDVNNRRRHGSPQSSRNLLAWSEADLATPPAPLGQGGQGGGGGQGGAFAGLSSGNSSVARGASGRLASAGSVHHAAVRPTSSSGSAAPGGKSGGPAGDGSELQPKDFISITSRPIGGGGGGLAPSSTCLHHGAASAADAPVPEGLMTGNEAGMPAATPVRQILGRSVVSVRDSSGAMTCAALGHPHPVYVLDPKFTAPSRRSPPRAPLLPPGAAAGSDGAVTAAAALVAAAPASLPVTSSEPADTNTVAAAATPPPPRALTDGVDIAAPGVGTAEAAFVGFVPELSSKPEKVFV